MPKHQKRGRNSVRTCGSTEINDLPCGRLYTMDAERAHHWLRLHCKVCKICDAYDFRTARDEAQTAQVGSHRYMSNSNSQRYQAEAMALKQGDRGLADMSRATMDMVASDDPQLRTGFQQARFEHPDHGSATAIFEEGFAGPLLERIREGGCGVCGKRFEHTEASSQFCPECLDGFVPGNHPVEDNRRSEVGAAVGDSLIRSMRAYQLARRDRPTWGAKQKQNNN